ncbi:CUB and sushi domain-containing protein 1-like [Lytechinus pictus]|uniref:CUB and sushi domain-containing protein 1-like n=1 Tax=Lytechinus pictus TaxID=7653 RepID=UPI0030BA0229
MEIFLMNKMKTSMISKLMLAVILQRVISILGHENICPPPRVYPNSEVEWSDRTLGAYATYSCRDGYEMDGPADTIVRYCNENGRWKSSIPPQCNVVQCQPPAVPAYGNVTYLSGRGEYGSVVYYQCGRYYKRFGTPSAQCLSDGTWSERAPTCQIRCGSPSLPNGTVTHLNDHVCLEFSEDRLDWPSAQARCQQNMGILVTIRDIEAQETIRATLMDIVDDGNTDRFWIGAEERRSSVAQATRNWQWVDGSLVEDVFWGNDEPTSATGSSSRGECVDLDPTTEYSWNDNDCSWEQRYICQFGVSGVCDDPGEPLHGSRALLACDQTGAQDDVIFVAGCLITFECDRGFRLVGESSSTCLSSGRWSNELPICERRQCPASPPSEHLEVKFSNSYRGVAVYRCPTASYVIEGDVFAYCLHNNVWSMPNLVCEPFSTMPVTTEPLLTPDWTFIGIVGALGILLFIAILIIIILAAVRNNNLNKRRKYIRPLPHATTTSRNRRSMENTYYSIRKPMPSPPEERSGHNVELKQVKRLSDASENATAVAQHSLTYDKSEVALTDDDYLEPIRVPHQESRRNSPRLSSGEYVNPMSPRSGTYDEVDDDVLVDDKTVEDDDRLLNNYIILLPDDDDNSEALRKVDGVAASKENDAVNEKDVDSRVGKDKEEMNEKDNAMGNKMDETKNKTVTSDTSTLPTNGLQIPTLGYSKEGFGSTVEL